MKKVVFIVFILFLGVIGLFLIHRDSPPDISERLLGMGIAVRSIDMLSDDGGRLDWSHTHGLIAFDRMEEDGFFALYTTNPDGSDTRCLTCDVGEFETRHVGQPSWHPTGDWILFQAEKETHPGSSVPSRPGFGRNNDIWVTGKDGGDAHVIFNAPLGSSILHPYFSHDGSKMVWAEKEVAPRPRGVVIEEIWMLKMADVVFDGARFSLANIRDIGPKKAFYEPHGFTMDDFKIIFTANLDGQEVWGMDIYTYDLESEKIQNLTNSSEVWDEHAKISPDGAYIAWMSSQDCDCDPSRLGDLRTDIWIMRSDGSDKRRATYFGERRAPERVGRKVIAGDSAWSRDGTQLIVRLIVDRNVAEIFGIEKERNPIMRIDFER